jgi:hypothetical protein
LRMKWSVVPTHTWAFTGPLESSSLMRLRTCAAV